MWRGTEPRPVEQRPTYKNEMAWGLSGLPIPSKRSRRKPVEKLKGFIEGWGESAVTVNCDCRSHGSYATFPRIAIVPS